jgi:hypothetical protein
MAERHDDDIRTSPIGTALSAAELDVVYGALEALDENADQVGLVVRFETDFAEFVRLRGLSSDGIVNPMLNPAFSRLAGNAFWLRVEDRLGHLVALFGAKVFEAANFMDLVRTGQLWFDREPLRAVDPRARPLDPFGRFGGVVSHGAGVWVAPQRRVRGISTLLSDMTRALLLKNHAIDWHTMTCIGKALRDQSERAYGFEMGLIYDGYCPMTDGDVELYLGRMARADTVERLKTPALLTTAAPQARVAAAG